MSLQFESCTIPALINHSMSTYKDNLLFSNIGNVEITYGQAEEKILTIQSIFKALDIKKGDKVVTQGGIMGTIHYVNDDGSLSLEVAENVTVKVAKGMIADISK